MNKTELRKKLNQPYDQQQWKNVVEFVFPNFAEFAGEQNLPIEPKDRDRIETFKQLGTVRLADGKNLALFELKLKENVNLLRNRVALNDIVASYIDQEQYHGVLSIFEQGKEDYRFTFAARASEFDENAGDFIAKRTDTKRFTYVLGKNESCRTAAERFFTLSESKDKANIEAVEDAFSVEKVSKRFFKDYIIEFDRLVAYLKGKPTYFQAIFEKDETAARNFVKRFMGRLVFLKFVQKKGWLGVPLSEPGWENGKYDFLESRFRESENKKNFLTQFLNPFFYEGLNTAGRPNYGFKEHDFKVPYLSGGLFESEYPADQRIDFDEESLHYLFDFFDRYNFTIDENDSMDREVGVDPEMLGHIFENLLEDNKDKGAFYTPKEIVRYMCQESIKEYLKTYLQEQNQWPQDADKRNELEEALDDFVTKKEAGKIIDFDIELATALKTVKICDPAIGSGAFPMGLLNEIFQLVYKLYDASPDKVGQIWEMEIWQPDTVKLNIIQQSIYGVDIEKGAVDIARLRFWLSLVVDSKEPQALPHLDYKIVVGDSLVSKLGNTIIDIDWEVTGDNAQTDMFGNTNVEQRKALLKNITEKQKLIFDPESDDDSLSLEIRNLKIDLLKNQLELMIKTKGTEDKPFVSGKKLKKQTELWLQTLEWKDLIKKLNQMKQGGKTPLEYFDWKLDFPEVMNEQVTDKVGFDIVIANPPYLKERDNAHIFESVNNSKFGNLYHQGKMDFWYYFLHKSIDITSTKGAITFITSRYWLNSMGAKTLIKRVNEKLSFATVVDIGKLKVFDNVAGHHMIHLYTKRINKVFKYKLLKNNIKSISAEKNNEDVKIYLLENKDTFINDQIIFDHNKLTIHSNKTLGTFYDLSQGVVEAADKVSSRQFKKVGKNDVEIGDGVFVLKSEELEKLNLSKEEKNHIVKYLDPNDIFKYVIIPKSKKYLIYSDDNLKNKIEKNNNFKSLKKHLNKYVDFITSSNGPYGIHRSRNKKFFTAKKILFPIMFAESHCAIDNNQFFVGMSFITIIQKDANYNLEQLSGILNSKFANYWFYTYGKKRGVGVDIGVNKLREFPLPNYQSVKVNETVVKILKLKKLNQDSFIEEQDIDNLVYKLYNLSYDEVLIIEPEFNERMSEQEYDALEV
jgi:adenine-specific DNA-methyltransferase